MRPPQGVNAESFLPHEHSFRMLTAQHRLFSSYKAFVCLFLYYLPSVDTVSLLFLIDSVFR